MTYRKKLIEVSLPLEAINLASAKEKNVRHGHPANLHMYWARRPLTSCRAVLFGMLVDDPSSIPEEFPSEDEQGKERDRLHRLCEQLVLWENSNNNSILHRARWEIARSVGRSKGIEPPAELNPTHLGVHEKKSNRQALIDWLHEHGPVIHDPFCGSGAIPFEATRLGLRTIGTDLNPVAIIVSKAAVEIPAKYSDLRPVNPNSTNKNCRGTEGLAADVQYYANMMIDEAKKRIGKHFSTVTITEEMANTSSKLKKYVGKEMTVLSWLWTRTVPSPNPVYDQIYVPLIRSFVLSKRKGKECWVEPVENGNGYSFSIREGKMPEHVIDGTISRSGGRCVVSNSPLTLKHVREMAKRGKMSHRLMAVVLEGDRERVYVSPENISSATEKIEYDLRRPTNLMPLKHRNFQTPAYGMTMFGDIFTDKQILVLNTLSDIILDIRKSIREDICRIIENGHQNPDKFDSYDVAVITYLSLLIGKQADLGNSLCRWEPNAQCPRQLFARQAIPMVWDFAEPNIFSNSSGSWNTLVKGFVSAMQKSLLIDCERDVSISQLNATQLDHSSNEVVYCTDPPYYDNICYADLSDFFYPWLKENIGDDYKEIFSTINTPKSDELVASPQRHGGKAGAESYFLNGMKLVMEKLALTNSLNIPICIYYAFKQKEIKDGATSSPGWVTFLDATISSGLKIVGTIPARTEASGRSVGQGANALSTSVVLVCRKREPDAKTIRRSEFLKLMKSELRPSVIALQEGGISPVDLAQAAIGPGIGVYSRFSAVMEADGSSMGVRHALELINDELSNILDETDLALDSETRTCLRWFVTHGLETKPFGDFEQLMKAINADYSVLSNSGSVLFEGGKARIAEIDSYPESFNPRDVGNAPAWAHVHRLIRLLDVKGESEAAAYMRHMPSHQRDSVRSLTYRLYQICDEKKMMEQAKNYNTLAVSWGQVADRSQKPAASTRVTLDEY